MPEMYRYRARLPRPGEGKNPRAELAVATAGTTATMYLYDVIDEWGGYWGVSSSEFAEALSEVGSDVDTIQLRINSPGGDVFEAIAIKNLLASHPAKVVAIVDGFAASAASFIAVAADETVMGENSELMIHDAHALARGNAEAFTAWAADLHRISDNIASIYAKKAPTMSTAEWRAVMVAEKWYPAEEAVSVGLADRVGAPDEGSTSNASSARRQFAAELGAVRTAAHGPVDTPIAAVVAISNTSTDTKEAARQQTDTGPAATAETGANRPEVTPPFTASSQSKDIDMANMTIEERQARITEIDARRTDINASHSGDILPPADQAEWDEITAEREDHFSAIAAQQARTQELAAAADNDAATENGQTTAARTPGVVKATPAVHIKPGNIYDTTAIRDRSRNRAEMAKGLRDNAMRAIEAAAFPGTDREEAQTRVSKMVDKFAGENDTALAERILNTGSSDYDTAFGKAVKAMSTSGLNPQELKALTLGTDTDGGYAVPFQLDPTVILTSAGSENPLRQISRVVQITGKKWEGLTSAGITVTRKGETDEATDDSPVFAQPTVETSRADGFVPFSIALEASWSELRDELTMMLSEAKLDEEASSFVTGAGTALTTGGVLPQGILTALSATTTTYVVTAATGGFTLADLRKMKSTLPERFRGDTDWLAADTFYDQADSLITQTTRDDIAQATGDALLSKPKRQASAMPDYSVTTNANLAIHGNFKRGFIIVDRIGMNVELVPTLFGSNGRPTGQRGIFAYWFNGSKALVPGAFRLLRAK